MSQADKARAFAELHRKGDPVILFNIWDAGSAKAVAEAGAKALPASLRPAFLPAGLSQAYLKRLEASGAAALDDIVTLPQWRRHWLMFRRATKGWG